MIKVVIWEAGLSLNPWLKLGRRFTLLISFQYVICFIKELFMEMEHIFRMLLISHMATPYQGKTTYIPCSSAKLSLVDHVWEKEGWCSQEQDITVLWIEGMIPTSLSFLTLTRYYHWTSLNILWREQCYHKDLSWNLTISCKQAGEKAVKLIVILTICAS